MERLTQRGLEIRCSYKKCRRYIIGDGDIMFKAYTRKEAVKSGYVKKGIWWLCAEHKDMTVEAIEAQFVKKRADGEDD